MYLFLYAKWKRIMSKGFGTYGSMPIITTTTTIIIWDFSYFLNCVAIHSNSSHFTTGASFFSKCLSYVTVFMVVRRVIYLIFLSHIHL